jgi:hypothetical protein
MREKTDYQPVFDYIESHYPEMVRQAKKKLHFKYCEDTSAHIELVNSVLTPVLIKVKEQKLFCEKANRLLQDGKLFLYLIKAIDSNAKFPSSPFLRSKLKLYRNKELTDNIQIADEEDIFEQIDLEDKLVALLTKEHFDRFFGKYSFLYLEIIKQYSKPGTTYKSIATYYGISKSSVANAIINVKARLKQELT